MEHFKVSDSTVTEIEKLVEEDIKKGNFMEIKNLDLI